MRGRRRHGVALILASLGALEAEVVTATPRRRTVQVVEAAAEPGHSYRTTFIVRHTRRGRARVTVQYLRGPRRLVGRQRTTMLLRPGLTTFVRDTTAPD